MTTTPPLIGLMGLKQSGKDTFAARLVAEHGYTRYALADPMREVALALDPIVDVAESDVISVRLSTVVGVHGWDVAKEHFPEVRRTLQRLGTEAGRDLLGEDFWIRLTNNFIRDTSTPVVVTDIRFPNEYRWIHERGGTLVRMIRPGQESTDVHVSEALAVDIVGYPADLTVLNGTTIEDLHEQADLLARVLQNNPSSSTRTPVR